MQHRGRHFYSKHRNPARLRRVGVRGHVLVCLWRRFPSCTFQLDKTDSHAVPMSTYCPPLHCGLHLWGSNTMAELIENTMKSAPGAPSLIQGSPMVHDYMEALQALGLLEPVRAKLHECHHSSNCSGKTK